MLSGVLSLVICVCLLLVPAPVAGQESSGFIGQAKDTSGAVLPGVTVTATSPALQVKEVTTVTDTKGEYRITPLPIGTYEITYVLPGFQTIKRQGLRLTQGFVARVDIELSLGGIEESVTVSGSSPVVDATSTSSATVLTQETLDLTPTDRNGLLTLVSETPGARGNLDVGGTALVTIPTINAFGQVADTWPVMDGVNTVSFRSSGGQFGNYFDYLAFEEARTETFGHDATIPRVGVFMSAIAKSGSNSFHGGGSFLFTNNSFQSNNVDDSLIAAGIKAPPNLNQRLDADVQLGGKIVQDKLWFYGAYRKRTNNSDILNAFQDDGAPAVLGQSQSFTTEKLSYQMTPKQQLTSYFQYATKGVTGNGVTPFVSWNSRSQQIWHAETTNVRWQWLPSDSLVTSFTVGLFNVDSRFVGFATVPPSIDLKTTKVTGDSTQDGSVSQDWNYDTSGTITWFKPRLFLGDHQFKAGFDYIAGSDVTGSAGSPYTSFETVFNGGAPFELYTFNWPIEPVVTVHYLGVYGQDSWKVASRLTLNLGLRYAHDNGFVPPTCREAGMFAAAGCSDKVQMNTWNAFAPRLHAAWDVMGDGRTVIKGGWGRFDHMREHNPELINVNPNQGTLTTWLWHDLNKDGQYQTGEVNLNTGSPDFVSLASSGGATLAAGVPNPDEKEPKIDEYSVSLERQLAANFALRVTGLMTHTFNTYRLLNTPRPYSSYNIPITKPDPGPDGVVGNGDDPGNSITYYAYPASLAGSAFSQTTLINDPNADQTFKSFEIATMKRLSHRWQFSAAYTATKKHIPFGNVPPLAYTPNAEINIADNTWEWEAKIAGAYQLPAGVTLAANYQNISGSAYARQVLFTTGGTSTVPSLVANVVPIGTYRTPAINLLDLRVEKAFSLPAGNKFIVRLNVYNSLNASTVLTVQQRSGTTFNQPTSIAPPRLYELGVTYSF
jgi:outer membrane receptor protein involved in Fe transport